MHLSMLCAMCLRPQCDLSNVDSFLVTPAEPHIGHLHSLLVADVLTRFHRLLNPSQVPLFSTGTDEHGMKIQRAATASNKPAKEFCDVISQSFIHLAHSFDCRYSHFIRTSDEEHSRVVTQVWKQLFASGYIYKAKYEGWYCVSDESFVPKYEEKQVDGQLVKVSPESGHPVEWHCEENYVFKLSHFRNQLLQWVHGDVNCVTPAKFHHYLKSVLDHFEWSDLSVSRPSSRLSWGIPVPEDPSHTIYVWLDALVNYLTVAHYPNGDKMTYWPPDVQVIGKDIIKFHAIYWPCFLMALGLPLPRKLLVHSHWTVDSIKMSKSLGNVVKPHDLKQEFTTDGVRYYLMRASNLVDDANFSLKVMRRTVNAELADTFGNLLSRVCAPSVNAAQEYPAYDPSVDIEGAHLAQEIEECLRKLPVTAAEAYERAHFNVVADEAMAILRMTNLFVHQQAPWKMVKDPALSGPVTRTLFTCLEVLRVTSIVLSPIVPAICARVLDKLDVPDSSRNWTDATVQFVPGIQMRPLSTVKAIVYSRVKTDETIVDS